MRRLIGVLALAMVTGAPHLASAADDPPGLKATALVTGDLAVCGSPTSAAVGRMVRASSGVFITAGDEAYPDGSDRDFADCYDPYFGHAKDRTLPVPGNHEYHTPGAAGYFRYFDVPPYYRRTVAGWSVYFLDSNCHEVHGCRRGTPQYRWLKSRLRKDSARCIAAVTHHPRWSSNKHGDNRMVAPLYRLLHRHGAAMLLSGHDHAYERFVRLGPKGRPNPRGPRQFVVGTGGGPLYTFKEPRTGSQVRKKVHGLLALRLRDGGYRWRMVTIKGKVVDRGRDRC